MNPNTYPNISDIYEYLEDLFGDWKNGKVPNYKEGLASIIEDTIKLDKVCILLTDLKSTLDEVLTTKITSNIKNECLKYIKRGNTLMAVRRYMDFTNCNVDDAFNYINELKHEQNESRSTNNSKES